MGLLGLYNVKEAAVKAYYGLFSLQHRGQESCGIFTSDEKDIRGYKNFGMVRHVFTDDVLRDLESNRPIHAIGQARYAAENQMAAANLEPMHFHHLRAQFAAASSGHLTNHRQLNTLLQERGAIFQSDSSSEILAHLLVQDSNKFLPALQKALSHMEGGFCFVILRRNKLYAMRDPLGIHPLSLGKLDDGWIVSSETCAFELLGADYVRDVEPGEIIEIREDNTVHSHRFAEARQGASCIMEYIYFARPDSNLDGINVHQSRYRAGIELARESAVDCDLVIGVPDSSLSAARGYSKASGIPNDQGLIKNKYSGRSFIENNQERRDLAVYLKLSPIRSLIEGKRVTLVDDSIVRGTTSRQLISMMRRSGATEVHLRIASPKMLAPCFYGMDTSNYEQLIGSRLSVDEIREYIGADSLYYLSNEGLRRAIGKTDFCDACFTENYPTKLYQYQEVIDNWHAKMNKEKGE